MPSGTASGGNSFFWATKSAGTNTASATHNGPVVSGVRMTWHRHWQSSPLSGIGSPGAQSQWSACSCPCHPQQSPKTSTAHAVSTNAETMAMNKLERKKRTGRGGNGGSAVLSRDRLGVMTNDEAPPVAADGRRRAAFFRAPHSALRVANRPPPAVGGYGRRGAK